MRGGFKGRLNFIKLVKKECLPSVFQEPCDSSLIRVLEGKKRPTRMKVLPNRCLTRRAMMVDKDERHALFMAVLQEF